MASYKVIGVGQDGKYMDDGARSSVLGYCLRSGKAAYVGGMAVNPGHAAEEMEILAQAYGQDHGLRLRHWIVSFESDEGMDPLKADQFARETIRHYGDRYQILYAVHTDAAHLHIHYGMNLVSYVDGRRYRGEKQDYYQYLNELNRVGRAYGIHVKPVKDREEPA